MLTTQAVINNPFSGVFGSGQVQIFTISGTWTVPAGIGKIRVRMWGAGGSGTATTVPGAGGGFCLKAIYDLSGVTSVAVTVAPSVTTLAGGTSSFGAYCSATGGGGTAGSVGGTGVGGDINNTGGSAGPSNSNGSGGAASIVGPGAAGSSSTGISSTGGAGGGGAANAGGSGLLGTGATPYVTGGMAVPATSGMSSGNASIDLFGMGGGGASSQVPNGVNGGGGGISGGGGFPGGGAYTGFPSGAGLVIVEW